MPLVASVANADVISSGLTSEVPRPIEHTEASRERIPIRWATSATASGPTSTVTCA